MNTKNKYEEIRKDVIDKRQEKSQNKVASTREMRRQIGRKNMKPKTVQMRELQRIMTINKNLINSLKQQVILSEQKITLLQQELKLVQETIKLWSQEEEPTEEDKLREKYTLEMHKNPIRGRKETQIYKKWKAKQK